MDNSIERYYVRYHGRGESIYLPDGKLKPFMDELESPLPTTIYTKVEEQVLEWLGYILSLEPIEREYICLAIKGLSLRQIEKELKKIKPISFENISKHLNRERKARPELEILFARLKRPVERLKGTRKAKVKVKKTVIRSENNLPNSGKILRKK